jgi:hypothetical protein
MVLGNTPRQRTNLYLDRAKSFSLELEFFDKNDNPLDVTTGTLRLVVEQPKRYGGEEIINRFSEHDVIANNITRFPLQAADLDLEPGEYPYDVTIINSAGYSTPGLKGVFVIGDNTDGDTSNTYGGVDPAKGVKVVIDDGDVIQVVLDYAVGVKGDTGDKGDQGDPGGVFVQDDTPDWENESPLYNPLWVDTDDDPPVDPNTPPPGGSTGQVLTKLSNDNYDWGWVTSGTEVESGLTWVDSTSGAPGDGKIGIDTAQLESATEVRYAVNNQFGDPIADLTALINQTDLITLSTDTTNVVWTVAGPVVNDTTHYTIPVTYSRGEGGDPVENQTVSTSWTPADQDHTHAEYVEWTGANIFGSANDWYVGTDGLTNNPRWRFYEPTDEIISAGKVRLAEGVAVMGALRVGGAYDSSPNMFSVYTPAYDTAPGPVTRHAAVTMVNEMKDGQPFILSRGTLDFHIDTLDQLLGRFVISSGSTPAEVFAVEHDGTATLEGDPVARVVVSDTEPTDPQVGTIWVPAT